MGSAPAEDDVGPAPADDERDGESPEATETRDTASGQQVRGPALVTLVVVLALAAGVLLGRWSASSQEVSAPGTTSVEAGFVRDMSAHHAQAVEMAMIAHARAATTEVRTLAYDIATSQENQRGQMMGWLQLWGLSLATSVERMEWMRAGGHGHAGSGSASMLLSDGRMPGMVSDAQLQKLREASGKDAEVLFLQLMITHHRAGVEMAQAAEASAEQPAMVRLATSMVAKQMTAMLATRGAKPTA